MIDFQESPGDSRKLNMNAPHMSIVYCAWDFKESAFAPENQKVISSTICFETTV